MRNRVNRLDDSFVTLDILLKYSKSHDLYPSAYQHPKPNHIPVPEAYNNNSTPPIRTNSQKAQELQPRPLTALPQTNKCTVFESKIQTHWSRDWSAQQITLCMVSLRVQSVNRLLENVAPVSPSPDLFLLRRAGANARGPGPGYHIIALIVRKSKRKKRTMGCNDSGNAQYYYSSAGRFVHPWCHESATKHQVLIYTLRFF